MAQIPVIMQIPVLVQITADINVYVTAAWVDAAVFLFIMAIMAGGAFSVDLIRDAEAYIRRYHMIEPGDLVAAGVSGGADSICLLLVLDALRERLGFHLAVVHVNHNLRGRDADADEAYVRRLCSERGIPLYVYSYPVREIAKSEKKGMEETGRLLRQRAFRSALDTFAASLGLSEAEQTRSGVNQEENEMPRGKGEVNQTENGVNRAESRVNQAENELPQPGEGIKPAGRRVALAHHANDLAETVLFQAVRGSSLSGLAGIRPVSLMDATWGNDDFAFTQEILSGETEDGLSLIGKIRGGLSLSGKARGGLSLSGKTRDGISLERRQERMTVIHPLLFARRKELETWLTEQGIAWRTDATNQDEEYARNGLRNKVIPYLEAHVNAAAVQHIRDLAEDAAQADAYLQAEARKKEAKLLDLHPLFPAAYSTIVSEDQASCAADRILIRDALVQEPEVLQRYILMDALTAVSGRKKDLGREQIRQLQALFSLSAGKRTDLPYGVQAVRVYNGVELRQAEAVSGASEEPVPVPVPVTGTGTCCFGEWRFTCTVTIRTPGSVKKIPPNRYTKRFDYDKIGNSIVFRTRRPGDRMAVTADGQTKKLKDYFINEKIPRDERDRIPLLASGQRIFWVIGGRISEDSKISGDTVRVLQITAERLQDDHHAIQ